MSLRRYCLVAAAAAMLPGCLPDPGPFYPRPGDSVATDSPAPGDGPGTVDGPPPPPPDGPLPDGQPPPSDGQPPRDMPSSPTFSQVWSQVIQPNCSCHQSSSPSGGLGMQNQTNAYNNLVGQSARSGGPCDGQTRVVAGDSASSVMYNKLVGGSALCGNTMPRNLPLLGQSLTDLVKSWIDSGAKQ